MTESIKQKGWLWRLARDRRIKRLIPKRIKTLGRRLLPLETYDPQKWLAEDPYARAEEISTYPAKYPVTLGIVREFTRIHSFYIGACRELGVPYRVVDLSGPDWIDVVRRCGCDAFLVRPSGQVTVWKQMFDERLRIMVRDLGLRIFPTLDEVWFYESKRRMHYWLAAHDVPHPRTWVFYDRRAAQAFADAAPLPLVFKADFGSGSMGVRIFRDRGPLQRWIDRCFRKGILKRGADRRDRQWGCVLFQAYLPNVTEWRMIRIGDSYLGYQKVRHGDFHSGSHRFQYGVPPSDLLDFVRGVTDQGRFRSMALDCFVTEDGRYLVNELQTTFGLHVTDGLPMQDGRPGRMLRDETSGQWRFEEGNFCRNKLCNLRVLDLLGQMGIQPNDA